jgi:hypothetical protein
MPFRDTARKVRAPVQRFGRGRLAALLIAAAMGYAIPAQALDVQPGMWRFTSQTRIRGIETPKMKPHSYDYCITSKDIAHQLVPPNTPCTVEDLKTAGNEVTWRLACDGGQAGEITGHGRVQFQGTSLQGVITTAISYPRTIETTQYLSGKRIGKCPPISKDPRDGGLRRYVPQQ